MKMLPNNLSNNLSTMCKMRIFSQATNNNISGIFVLTKKPMQKETYLIMTLIKNKVINKMNNNKDDDDYNDEKDNDNVIFEFCFHTTNFFEWCLSKYLLFPQ